MIRQLKAKRAAELNAAKAIVAKATEEGRDLSAEEQASIDGHLKAAEGLASGIDRQERLDAELAKLDIPERRRVEESKIDPNAENPASPLPAPKISRVGKLAHFKDQGAAYRFGMWFIGAVMGRQIGKKFCASHGIPLAVENEGTNDQGGYLVPPEFSAEIIDLRELYGVFRRYAKIEPMARETKAIPRRTGGLTAYWNGESAANTESSKAWDNVNLIAKKLAVLTRMSSEVNEDAIINLADDLAGEIAYAFSNAEDEAGFNGDGESTYGGITGVRGKLKGLSGTIANIAGLVVGAGNAYSELLLTNFESVTGRLPIYADHPDVSWFVHRQFYYDVMVKLALAAGGVTGVEIGGGRRQQIFLGYPVVFSQVMPKAEGNSQVCALFGCLRMAAMLGDRRQVTLATSTEASIGGQSLFERDQIGLRGTQRIDINVHSVGNAHATAASRVPGPMVGLITAAS